MLNDNSSLAGKINDSRKKLGLSQEALAEKANVSLSTIQRIEKGKVIPRAFTVKILAETLGLDISELTSNPAQNESSEFSFSILKKINLATLFFFLIPFINLIIPLVLWKKHKKFQFKNAIAGKIVSFQLLWSITTIIGMAITLFLTNLILGKAGNGLNISILFYLTSVLFNAFIIAKTSSQLNHKEENILSFVPNLF